MTKRDNLLTAHAISSRHDADLTELCFSDRPFVLNGGEVRHIHMQDLLPRSVPGLNLMDVLKMRGQLQNAFERPLATRPGDASFDCFFFRHLFSFTRTLETGTLVYDMTDVMSRKIFLILMAD